MANSPTIRPDKFGIILLASPKASPTGRYVFFVGRHFDGKDTCYDIGACNMTIPGHPVVRRHYSTAYNPKAKEEAMAYWTELTNLLNEIETMEDESSERSRLLIFEPNQPKVH